LRHDRLLFSDCKGTNKQAIDKGKLLFSCLKLFYLSHKRAFPAVKVWSFGTPTKLYTLFLGYKENFSYFCSRNQPYKTIKHL